MDGCLGLDLVIKSTPENHELSLNPLFLPASCLSKLKGGNHTSPGGIWQFSGNVLATWWASEGYAMWIYAGTCDLDGWTWKGPLVLEWKSSRCLKKFFLQRHRAAPAAYLTHRLPDSGLGAESRQEAPTYVLWIATFDSSLLLLLFSH